MEKRGVGVMEGVFQRYKDKVRQRQKKTFSLTKKKELKKVKVIYKDQYDRSRIDKLRAINKLLFRLCANQVIVPNILIMITY